MPKNTYGWTPSPPDHRDILYTMVRPLKDVAALPRKVNLAKSPKLNNSVWNPFNQSRLGSCGPNTAAGDLIHSALYRENQPTTPMPSRLFIYWVTRYLMGTVNQDSGVNNRAMLKALNKYGWCDESLCPYDINRFTEQPSQAAFEQAAKRKISQYVAVEQSLDVMRAALAAGDTFIFGFSVYQSFEDSQTERTGDIPMPSRSENQLGGHDVLIVGYDDDAGMFDIRNSYGMEWGNSGYGRIPYEYATNRNLAGDFWSILNDGNAVDPVPTPTPTPTPEPTSGRWRIEGEGKKPVFSWL